MKSAPNDTPVWELPRHGFPGPAERSGRMSAAELSAGHLSALRGDVVLPALVLRESALENNLRVLANFTRGRGVRFAPHAKTSLAGSQRLNVVPWPTLDSTSTHPACLVTIE